MFYKIYAESVNKLFIQNLIMFLFVKNILAHDNFIHDKHGIKMGVKQKGCDNGEDDLIVDWNKSPTDYLCFNMKSTFKTNIEIKSELTCQNISSDYMPYHFCMKTKLEYDEYIPTFGDHRPLWPIYGEYLYLPVQRWLHSLEHGAIVMLYHPCANSIEVGKMRRILTNCLRRHVISPNKYLTNEKPIVLLAWGCKLEFNYVNQTESISFIKKYALKAPESSNALQGQFNKELLKVSNIVKNSDYLDTNICPEINFSSKN